MIHELIVTSLNEDGSVHIAPMGIREEDGLIVIAPFKPSTSLENIKREQSVVINMTDNVKIFAGCLTGRKDWETVPAVKIKGQYLKETLTHRELEVVRFEENEVRPQFFCKVIHEKTHKPFSGFNRAQSAVLETAILASRLHMLPVEKINTEIEYHKIAIEKTAGENELEAWGWLMDKIEQFKKNNQEKDFA